MQASDTWEEFEALFDKAMKQANRNNELTGI